MAVTALGLLIGSPAFAAAVLPTGGKVTAGSGAIVQSGQTLTVTQTSTRMDAQWQSFDIGRGYTVQFVQPTASSVALNRVLGPDVSTIQGALKANGQVFLMNPNGVLFTPSARVDVGGLVASTLALSADDVSNGRYTFQGPQATTGGSAAIINQGTIRAVGDGLGGGTVAMIAARIDNAGTIEAHKGQVLMGAGSKVTLDLGGPVKLHVDEGALETWIASGGAIRADGGHVLLSSRAAGDLTRSVINHTGVTQAQSLGTGEHGEVILFAHDGTLQVGGSLSAADGFVETSGRVLTTQPGAKVSAAQWLVDPVSITIDTNLAQTVQSALGSGNVTLTTSGNNTPSTTAGESGSAGDINVNAALQWSADTTLTLHAHRNIAINQPITATGSAGKLALHYGQGATAAGNNANYTVNAPVNLRAGANFSTKLGSDGTITPYTVITSLGAAASTSPTDLQGINASLGGNYALGADIDATATATWNFNGTNYAGFTALGSTASPFVGNFEGLGHRIDRISQPYGLNHTGLFGHIGPSGSVRNVGVTNIAVTKAGYGDNAYLIPVGAIAGNNQGKLWNVYSSGQLNNGGPDYNAFGGLVGINSGVIENSQSSVVISSANWGTDAGGVAGIHSGTISKSFATGALTASGRFVSLGGLVGKMNGGEVKDAYATGALTSSGFSGGTLNNVGGLIGTLNNGSVTNTYATGRISTANGAGLIYQRNGGTVVNSYWDKIATNRNGSAGGTGLTTAQMQTASTFTSAGWSTSDWGFSPGVNNGYPLLSAFFPDATFATRLYLRLTPGSSVYGQAPTLSYALYTSSSGGSVVSDAAPSGTVFWKEVVPNATSSVGTYGLTYGSGLTLGNSAYVVRAGSAETWTVSARPITVTADAKSKTYGSADPALTYAITSGSLVGGDTLAGSLSRAAGENVGSYTIDASALANSNYLITAQNGSLTISARPITVTADAKSKTYGSAD
ncbi:MAG: filamentous hemagglutinin N-terminal domain-containing protein, partial [Rubrivivax sp.]